MAARVTCDICNEEIQANLRKYNIKMQMIREAGEAESFESYSREVEFTTICKNCYKEIIKKINAIGCFIEDIPEG